MAERKPEIIWCFPHATRFELEELRKSYLAELKEGTGYDWIGEFDESGRFHAVPAERTDAKKSES